MYSDKLACQCPDLSRLSQELASTVFRSQSTLRVRECSANGQSMRNDASIHWIRLNFKRGIHGQHNAPPPFLLYRRDTIIPKVVPLIACVCREN